MNQYNYLIVADNFDKVGVLSAKNTKEATHQCLELVKLKNSKEVKIRVKIKWKE